MTILSARELSGECLRCGYDLRGIANERACPECGLLAASREDVIRAGLASLQQQEALGDVAPRELNEFLADGERSIREKVTLDGEKAYRARRPRRSRNKAR